MSKETPPKPQSKEVKIEWLGKRPSLSQIYSTGLEYCFISSDNRQCCPFVFCKDFLQDVIQAIYHKKTIKIYGFVYNPKECEPICMNRTKLAIVNSSDNEFNDKIPSLLDFVNQFEKKLKLIRTKARKIDNPPPKYKNGAWLLESSNRWMLSPPMLSMYTLLLRIGFCHKKDNKYTDTLEGILSGKIKPYQREDNEQLEQAKNGIDKILKFGYAKVFFKDPQKNYPDIATSNMHHHTGICSFSNETTKNYVSHWHRSLTQNKKPSKKGKESA